MTLLQPAAVLLLLPLLVLFPARGTASAQPPVTGPPPVAVIVQRAQFSELADALEALGTLKANETVELTASVSDILTEIHFQDGQQVEKGQVLVELNASEQRALLAEARSQAEEARRQAERLGNLVRRGQAAESLLDERVREAQSAEARLQAVQSRLADRTIRAPFSGMIGLRQISPGAWVSPGDRIATLIDQSEMKLDFTVPSVYLSTLRRGTPLEARSPAFPGRIFHGEVTSIESTVNPVTRSITVRARIPNDSGMLVPGLLMTLNLLRDQRDALVIAEEAIIARGSTTFVMIVDQEHEPAVVEERAVELGARVPGKVEVLTGIVPGELVVTHGTLKLRPGATVTISAIDDGSRPISELIRAELPRPDTGGQSG